jgi:PAS domain S-box-containing protein
VRAHKVLSACNHCLVRADDEDTFLSDICKIIVDVGGYRMAWVGYIDNAADTDQHHKTVRPVAQRGYEDGYLESIEIRWDFSEHGRGPTGTAIRTAAPAVVRNILTDDSFLPWRDEAERRGYGSVIGLPLQTESKTLGALTIYAVEADAFDREEVSLLSGLADDLAYGISVLRARHAHEEAVQSLTHFEAKARALLDAMPDTMVTLSADGKCLAIQVNAVGEMWLPPSEMVGQNFCALLPEAVGKQYQHHMRKALETGKRQVFEYALAANGGVHNYETRLVTMGEQRILAIVRDITERKTHEAVIEEERARIARDLHDGLAQNLYFLGLKIDYLAKQVTKEPKTTYQELCALKKTIQANIQDVRRTIFALRPVDLDVGFDIAIRTYVREFGEQANIPVTYEVVGAEETLPRALEPVLFRLIQEGLNNVAKHANCTRAWVQLSIEPDHLVRLAIGDDGVGFVPDGLLTAGGTKLGLSQMRQRVDMAGGTFSVQSVPSEGTTVQAEIPLANQRQSEGGPA